MAHTEHERKAFLNQATFLSGLAQAVAAYNQTDEPKIDMGWLIAELTEAAEECESEANA